MAAPATGLVSFDAITHTYRVDGAIVPSVTEILSACGLTLEFESAAFRDAAAFRADLGTKVHLACELDDRNDLDDSSLDDLVRPYLEAWRHFRAESQLRIAAVEEIVLDGLFRWAGRLDRRGWLFGDSRQTVIDIKTGAPARSHLLQTWAYALCFPTIGVNRRVVYLRSDGTYKAVAPTAQQTLEDRQDWAACVQMFQTLRRYGKWKTLSCP